MTPIHTKELELDITCAGQTKTHELRVMYTVMLPPIRRGTDASGLTFLIDSEVSTQVEIQYIDEIVSTKDKGIKTETVAYLETEYSKLICNSQEHIEAIEREILEEME